MSRFYYLLQRKLCQVILGVCVFGLIIGSESSIKAAAATQVTVQIAPICRYRIENSRIFRSDDSGKLIQEMEVAVLSNSERPWQLVLYSGQNAAGLEWSTDGRTWDEITGNTVILSGTRSFWERYLVYFRQADVNRPFTSSLTYQIMFED